MWSPRRGRTRASRKILLADTRAALADIGIDIGTLADYRTVENSAKVHNVVVCTLCSCYPKFLLGIPPAWYKSLAYRSRVVIEPWAVLEEFGVKVKSGVEVRVHDSTAELRYLVLPGAQRAPRGGPQRNWPACHARCHDRHGHSGGSEIGAAVGGRIGT